MNLTVLKRTIRALRNPTILRRKAGIIAVRPFVSPSPEEISFLNRDWDTLVILDACRFDLMEELDPFGPPVQRVLSNASQTREFLSQNFGTQELLDTVYVTASPQLTACKATFAHVEHVWQSEWNNQLNTVMPSSVTEAALKINERFPKKRLIVHYMQPHYPFIGETGRRIEEQASFHLTPKGTSIWEKLQGGELSEVEVRQAYRENLELVIPEAQRLVDSLRGKTVITSDHGNLFGKQVSPLPIRVYGHPARIHDHELTAVPWVEFPFESRRKITYRSEPMTQTEDFAEVEERLNDLGYT